MQHAIVRASSLIGAAGAVLLVAGGGFALASTGGHTSVTGPEVVSGVVHGKAAIANTTHIPLRLTGVVRTTDHGFALGPGGNSNSDHTLKTAARASATPATTSRPWPRAPSRPSWRRASLPPGSRGGTLKFWAGPVARLGLVRN